MSLGFIVKSSLVLSLFALATLAYAKPNFKVPCPPVNKIKQSAQYIDTTFKLSEGFVAVTHTPVQIDGLAWFIQANDLNVADSDAAIKAGKLAVKSVGSQDGKGKFKDKDGKVYICQYGPSDVVAVTLENNNARISLPLPKF